MYGPLTQAIIDQGSTAVFIDGILVKVADWTLVGNSVQLASAPVLGQTVSVFYLYNGIIPTPPAPTGTENVEYRTISSPEFVAGQLTLSSTPSSPSKVLVDMIGGGTQIFAIDFTVASNQLIWSGYALSGLIGVGDTLRVQYWS